LLNVLLVYVNRHSISIPEEDRIAVVLAWFVVTVVLAITGFCVSKTGYSKEKAGAGFAISGMALNGIIILPALVFFLYILISSTNDRKYRK